MNYTNIADIPLGKVVIAGKFRVDQHPAVVLFDSGASHSFMTPHLHPSLNKKHTL